MQTGFKKNYIQLTFSNVDIYDLIAHILGITPAKNDPVFREVKIILIATSTEKNDIFSHEKL